MQRYQQQLLFFTLFIAFTYAEVEIVSFLTKNGNASIYSSQVELEAKVTGCTECDCTVQIADTIDDLHKFVVKPETKSVPVEIKDLNSHTTYKFNLTCKETKEKEPKPVQKEFDVTTDFGRPLAPELVQADIPQGSKKIYVKWMPSFISPGQNIEYSISIDGKHMKKTTETAFVMANDYTPGIQHTIIVSACYKNNQEKIVCSQDGKNNKIEFKIDITTTTSTSTSTSTSTTTAKSSGILSYSISISMIIFSLFVCIQMK